MNCARTALWGAWATSIAQAYPEVQGSGKKRTSGAVLVESALREFILTYLSTVCHASLPALLSKDYLRYQVFCDTQ